MRDEIYVGKLISEEALAHSSGLWKKHKYIKKIGDRYYYTKEQLKKAGKEATTAVKMELDGHSGYAKDSADNYAKQAKGDLKAIEKQNAIIEDAEAGRSSADVEYERDWKEQYKKQFARNRDNARKFEQIHAKTLSGRAEIAAKTAKNKLTRRSRLSSMAGKSWQKSTKEEMEARNARVDSKNYYKTDAERAAAQKHAEKHEKNAVANKRLQYARQSEYERTSMKARSERAKKRLEQALKRTRKKK